MKLNKYIGLAAMPLFFAACQNDTLGETLQQENGIFTLSGSMPGGTAMSRAQIALGNTDSSKESFLWNEGDQFALYQGNEENLTTHVFSISSDYRETGDGDKKNATFTTDNPAQAIKYVAIYPADVMINKGTAEFRLQQDLDFSSAATLEEQNLVWKDYLQNNMFMMATGELSGSGDNIVNFSHLCAMARITYTNQTAEKQSIDFIRLGGEQGFTTSISYYIPGQYQRGSGGTNWYQISTHGLTVEAGVTTDFYIMFFPRDFENRLDITMNFSSDERQVSLDVADILAANNGAKGFEAGKRYWFKLTGYDTGLVWSKDFTTDVATIENPLLAIALRDVLGPEMVTVHEDSTASIGVMDARAVTRLHMEGWKLNSLDGIEIFSNLRELNVGNTGIKSFDASVLPKLETLDIYANQMTSLNLKGCSKINRLSCENNQLKELDLSDLTNLEMLNCNVNLLSSLDLSANKYITWLGCEVNLLTYLDLSMMETNSGYFLLGGQGNAQGQELTITVKFTEEFKEHWYNSLTQDGHNSERVVIEGEAVPAEDEIMIGSKSFSTALYNLFGAENVTLTETGRAILKQDFAASITSLNLNGQTGITSLSGIGNLVNLEQLWADGVGLEGSFDFYQNKALKYLDLSRNPGITDIWVQNNLNLTHLFLVDSPISNMDVTRNFNLESLLIVNSNIWKLDVSNNPKLNHLNCRENRLEELDVTRNPLLTQLYCGGQRDDITMHVTMTSTQKEWWDKDYVDRWENTNVEVTIKDLVSGGNGNLDNFGSGGEF